MPKTTIEAQRKYQHEWYKRKRDERLALAQNRLGNVCNICGTDRDLEFHHKDPAKKLFTIGGGLLRPIKQFLAEVDKCVLLCIQHHDAETRASLNYYEVGIVEGRPHGVITTYNNGCRCKECRKANVLRVCRNRNTSLS